MEQDAVQEKPNAGGENFEHSYSQLNDSIQVALRGNFEMDKIPELMAFFRATLGEGRHNWEIDLRELHYLNSEFIGTLILMNTLVGANKGAFRLLTDKDSKIMDLFVQAKLDRIMHIRTI